MPSTTTPTVVFRRRSRARSTANVAVLSVLLFVAGCEWVATPTYDGPSRPNFVFRYLTRDGADGYTSSAVKGTVQLSGPPTNTGTNTRMVLFPSAQPSSIDQQACATWSTQTDLRTQQGLALRIRADQPEGRWRAVTVLKNVLWGANWNFNVLTWDTRNPSGWTTHGTVDLNRVFWPNQQLAPFPWRVCARVTGDVVTVKGWRAGTPEPPWNDPNHTGSVRLPPEWSYPGQAGWYVGHLPSGQQTTFTDLTLHQLTLESTP